tara:strand:+ start:1329 stop:1856 length:528 start_codon:yes stop_codon:yes gene_type:complete
MIKTIIAFLLLPLTANAFIGVSNTVFAQDYKEYNTQKIENGLSLNLNYYKPISEKYIIGVSTNRLTSQFLRAEGYLIRKDDKVAIKTKTKLTTDSIGLFRGFNKYLVGGNVINARKDSNLYLSNTKINNNKESELLFGVSFGKILDGGVLTATYIFKNEDFDLKRGINFSYAFKF